MVREVMDVLITDLVQRINCRVDYHENEMVELMASMRGNGLLSPIGIRPDTRNDKWEVVFGNRRFLAAKKLGWKKIPCIFVEAATKSESDMLLVNCTENAVRSEPSIIEMGMVYKRLIDNGLTQKEIAARMGKSVDSIKNALSALRTIPAEHYDKIKVGKNRKGGISATVAVRIEKLRKKGSISAIQARAFYQKLSSGQLTSNQVSKLLTEARAGKSAEKIEKDSQNLKVVTMTLHCSKRVLAKHSFESSHQINDALKKLITRAYPDLLL